MSSSDAHDVVDQVRDRLRAAIAPAPSGMATVYPPDGEPYVARLQHLPLRPAPSTLISRAAQLLEQAAMTLAADGQVDAGQACYRQAEEVVALQGAVQLVEAVPA